MRDCLPRANYKLRTVLKHSCLELSGTVHYTSSKAELATREAERTQETRYM